MVNKSKINDQRFWNGWKNSGAVGTGMGFYYDKAPRILAGMRRQSAREFPFSSRFPLELEVVIGNNYKIMSTSARTRLGVLYAIYRKSGERGWSESQDRYDFSLLVKPDEVQGMFTLWSKDGKIFEKTGYDKLEVTLATHEETAGLKESYT